MTELFTIPISTGGTFVCSTPTPAPSTTSAEDRDKQNNNNEEKIYLLTFTSPPDNRLTPAFIDAFILSLDIIEHRYEKGVVITTSGIGKFFSNGLDLEKVMSTDRFWERYLWKLFRRLLTYPLPTVALINGHAFAGGLMLAMYHDYRVQNPSRGFLCLNEIYLGIPLEQPMVRIFREKVGLPTTLRSLVLEGKRFAGPEALNAQLVDALGGLEEAIGLVHERKLFDMARSPAYTGLKEGMFQHTLAALDDEPGNQAWQDFIGKIKESNAEEASSGVKQWELQRKHGKGAKM